MNVNIFFEDSHAIKEKKRQLWWQMPVINENGTSRV
jgi:hypothetical protein